ncbi:hypothetical protein ElyMa_002647700 [Elysia marginata]|uniref:Uncharacterized protein n=1 Tax=Elysia marginata TaxID=1093978 RepID=A0AAV4H6R7_9GAST|nr:hypothetical protein ElyMa_002647700 [Elysia marginata]
MDVADQCAHAFRGNFYLGAIMFLGIAVSNYLRQGDNVEQEAVDDQRAGEEQEDSNQRAGGEQEVSYPSSPENKMEEISKVEKHTVLFLPR